MAGENEVKIRVSLVDDATAKMKQVSQSVTNMGNNAKSRLESATGASMAFAGGLLAVGTAVGVAAAAMVNKAAQFEQTKVAFETMTGSAEKADKLLRDMAEFAKRTPFELEGLQEATKRLLAYGVSSETVLDELEVLGNIAAGVGMDKLPQLTLAYGQVRAATKLTGAELRQFTEAGIPLLEELSKVTGMTTKEMAGNIGDLDITFEQVQQALQNMTGEGGRFNDLMTKQSGTFLGMISNIKDALGQFMIAAGTPLLEALKPWLQQLMVATQTVLPQLLEALKGTIRWFDEHRFALTLVVGAIMGALIPAFVAVAGIIMTTVVPAILAGTAALLPWIALGAAVAAALYVLYLAYESNFLGIRTTLEDFMTFASPWFGEVNRLVQEHGGIAGTVSDAWSITVTEWSGLLELIGLRVSTTFQNIKNWINGTWIDVQLAWQSMWTGIGTWFDETLKGLENMVVGWYNRIIGMINMLLPKFAEIETATTKAQRSSSSSSRNSTPARRAFGGFVDSNLNVQRAAFGNMITGGRGIDNIPVLATAGELILDQAGQDNVAAAIAAGRRSEPSVHVHIYGNNFYGDDDEFVEKIGDSIINMFKLHYQSPSF